MMLEAVTEAPVSAPAPTTTTVGDLPNMPIEATPIQVEGKVQGNSLWLVWVVVAFLAGTALGGGVGYVVWGNGEAKMAVETTVQLVPTGKSAPTSAAATPTVEPKRNEIKIKILNGSGVPGEAGKARDLLLSLGYKNIDTANADRSDYEKTEVSVKASAKSYGELLKADLESKYSVETGTSDVAESEAHDAIVIIGLK